MIQTIKKLIQKNMPNEFIERITGYGEKQIEKIREEAKKNNEELKNNTEK